MRHLRIIGLALVAALALSAGAASASAHVFNSTVTGKLKVVSNNEQVFSTGGTTPTKVVCLKVETVTGEAKAGKQETIESEVSYKECTLAVGIKTPVGAEVSNPTYLFNANEFVNNEKEVKIVSTGCTVVVPKQAGLKAVKYKNEGKDVNVESNVVGIHWSETGLTCGTHEGTEATYTGNALIEVVGGEAKWE